MVTNRVIYNNQLLFVGPAPASGHYFSDPLGNLAQTGIYNLIQPLKRINTFSYQITANPFRGTQLNTSNNIYDINISQPNVEINFDYYIKDLRNEARMGFYVKLSPANLDQLDGGNPYPSGNLLSGFAFSDTYFSFSGDLTQSTNNTFRYPFKYRDNRNLFLVINPNPDDAIGSNISGFNVLGFGNCYINSYKVRAQVGDIPRASVGYVAANVTFYSSGVSGISPYLDPKSGNPNPSVKFNIPNYNTAIEEQGNSLSVLVPGDITLDLYDYNTTNKTKSNLILQDSAIQSFNFSLPLERESLNSLGYELALDRHINSPITIDFDFTSLFKNLMYTGNLPNHITQESKYYAVIKLNKSGIPIVRYDLNGLKLKNYSYDSSIGANSAINFSFYCDMDVNSFPFTDGLSMSGAMLGFNYTNFATNGPF